jgi:hypothetical protein
MLEPILTFRNNLSPYNQLVSLNYIQNSPSGAILPVVRGENSNPVSFRIYNNYGLSAGIASALNVEVTTYDGIGISSHTATKSTVGQQWIVINQTGYGENTTTPGLLTYWKSESLAIGGSDDVFIPDKGSDGSLSQIIRAGADENSCGFLEFSSYAEVPEDAGAGQTTFAITVIYDWSS